MHIDHLISTNGFLVSSARFGVLKIGSPYPPTRAVETKALGIIIVINLETQVKKFYTSLFEQFYQKVFCSGKQTLDLIS